MEVKKSNSPAFPLGALKKTMGFLHKLEAIFWTMIILDVFFGDYTTLGFLGAVITRYGNPYENQTV